MHDTITQIPLSERERILRANKGMLTRVAKSLPSASRRSKTGKSAGHVSVMSVSEVYWTRRGQRVKSERIEKALLREIAKFETMPPEQQAAEVL